MKKIKTNLLALCVLLGAGAFVSQSYAANIFSVDAQDTTTLKVTFSGAVSLGEQPTGEVKVLKDIAVESATKDPTSQKIINLSLATDLIPESTYSLISIFGAEGSIDFSLGASMSNVEVTSTDPNSTIAKILIKDSKRIDIYYKTDVNGTEFEFKILSNLGVDTLGVDLSGNLIVKTKSLLEASTGYILMLINLKTNDGTEIVLEDSIYDFTTPVFAAPVEEVMTQTPNSTQDVPPADAPQAPVPQAPQALGNLNVETQTQSGSQDVTTSLQTEEGNVEQVALNAAATPDTGAETWVILLGTLCINSFAYLYRRKKA